MNHPIELRAAMPRALEEALRAATQSPTPGPSTRPVARIAGVEFSIEPGQIFAVAGLSAKGKSALTRRLATHVENGLIFMDEPFSKLEQPARARLRETLVELHREMESTIVFVTEDVEEALAVGDQVVVTRGTTLPDDSCS
jgi:ABC-type proline/glycine betaine transport system ATPase subunit